MIKLGHFRSVSIINKPVRKPIKVMCLRSPARTQVAASPYRGQMFLFFPNLHEKTYNKLFPSISLCVLLLGELMIQPKAFGHLLK